jgi:hypothetical protein
MPPRPRARAAAWLLLLLLLLPVLGSRLAGRPARCHDLAGRRQRGAVG